MNDISKDKDYQEFILENETCLPCHWAYCERISWQLFRLKVEKDRIQLSQPFLSCICRHYFYREEIIIYCKLLCRPSRCCVTAVLLLRFSCDAIVWQLSHTTWVSIVGVGGTWTIMNLWSIHGKPSEKQRPWMMWVKIPFRWHCIWRKDVIFANKKRHNRLEEILSITKQAGGNNCEQWQSSRCLKKR